MIPRRQAVVAVLLIACGAGVLAIPGRVEGPVVVPFGPGHGLSVVDMIGFVLVVPGGLWLLGVLLRNLPALGLPPRALFGLGVAGGAGLGLTIASVFGGFGGWWIAGLTMLTVIEAYLLAVMWRRA